MADPKPDSAGAARLVMSGGPLAGSEYPLPARSGTIVIGSSIDADIQIVLGNVEGIHASISRSGAGFVLADVGSATGTFLNGEKLEGDSPLADGDEISLGSPGMKGSAKLVLRLPAPSRPDAGPGLELPATPALFGDAAGLPALGGPTGGSFFEDAAPPSLEGEPAPPAASPETPRPVPVKATLPPPPPPRSATKLTAPPPPPRRTEPPVGPEEVLPSMAAPPPRPEPADVAETDDIVDAVPEPAERSFPSLKPRAPEKRKRGGGGRPSARRRSLVGLLLSVPVLAGAGVILVVAATVYFGRGLFESNPPVLSAVAPQEAAPGQTVTLRGTRFAPDPSGNQVLFGSLPATVRAASETELQVVMPAGTPAQVPVVVQTSGGRSQPLMMKAAAASEVSAIEPEVAWTGQPILIRGAGLASGQVSVTIGGLAPSSVETGPDGIRAVVPDLGLPEGAKTTVTVRSGGRSQSFEMLVGHLPLLLDVEPKTGRVGQKVVLKGRGFGTQPRANTVTFGRQAALVLAAKPTELEVFVPGSAGDAPELPVTVIVAGQASRGSLVFQATRAGGAQFVPRFFPDAVTEAPGQDLAFVSTELGPVVLLGGAAGSASTAQRAMDVANALNGLIDASRGTPPTFELRQGTSVAVAGTPRPLLVATGGDAAAYSRSWDGRARGVGAPAVARHWVALLQDYLGLFIARRRPVQTLATSSRGRVLGDIWADARRRAPGERSVPTSVAVNAASTMGQQLRLLALVVGSEAPRVHAAVEGRWQGRIDDPETGGRAFSAQIQSQGSATLSGTLATRMGSIEVRSTLREIAFERGVLRFTATLQGVASRFRGTVEDGTVRGTVEREGRPPLDFAMEFVE